MKIIVLDKRTLGEDVEVSCFGKYGELVVREETDAKELGDVISDADVLILNKVKLLGKTLEQARKLKLICVAATGYDNIDTDYCREHAIAVCNVPGYSTDTVAQVTLAMAFSLATHLTEYDRYVKTGAYSAGTQANCLVPVYHDMCGRTYGIVGMGNIGKKVAEIASAIGMKVLCYRKNPGGPYPCVSLEELCRESDFISLHVPLTKETNHLISREKIALMKPSAILINVARGAVVDEEAVAEAVEQGKLGGFGCDVYSQEPFPADHPYGRLSSLPNVLLTPHMAWGSHESRERCVTVMMNNIDSFLNGQTLNRIV